MSAAHRTAKTLMPTVGALITRSAEWLRQKGVDAPRLDADILLAHVLGCDRLRLYMEWHKPLTELEVAAYRDLVARRGRERLPIARLLGRKEFRGLEFEVTPEVFVPRPETEGVVERGLHLLATDPAMQVDRPVVFDACTGSGCIIICMAVKQPRAQYLASDRSDAALAVARRNAARHQVEARIAFRQGSGLAGFRGPVHLLVANPPYIASAQIPGLPPEVRVHDPALALDGGADGLDTLRELLSQCREALLPGGHLVMELGEEQESDAVKIGQESGFLEDVRMERDEAGHARYFMARRHL